MADNAQQYSRQRRKRELQLARREVSSGSDTATTNDPPATETTTRKAKIQNSDITGLKYFDQLAPLLERLRDDACERDKAGNRELHFDQYCLLILLYLFNPVVTSLRGIQQASELDKVQNKLGCSRASLGSLSEASSVFDAERLQEIIHELGAELKPLARDPRLKDITQTLTLVDGTLIAALPRIMEASRLKQDTGSGLIKWRLHTHFEVDRSVPKRIDVTPEGGGGTDRRLVATNARCSSGRSSRTGCTRWTAVMPSSHCSIRSSQPAAVTSAACATTVPMKSSSSAS